MSSEARTRYLIEQATEERISSLESELDAVKTELEGIKKVLVKPEPVKAAPPSPVRKTAK